MKGCIAFYLLLCGYVWGCGSSASSDGQLPTVRSAAVDSLASIMKSSEQKASYPAYRDTSYTILVDKMPVDVLWPATTSINGTILLLPGWSFARNDWCQKATLCKRAKDSGYVLICPEMYKSIYADSLYPETRADWRVQPTRQWMRERLIPHLQNKEGLLLSKQRNMLVGLSTGGRGVALLSQDFPELFCAGVALSGDFDQRLQPADNLIRGWYGAIERFPERWVSHDNPTHRLSRLTVPLYLGHGEQDAICPVFQTTTFYQAIRKQNPHLSVQLHIAPGMGHDYRYWQSEEDSLFAFIGRHCSGK